MEIFWAGFRVKQNDSFTLKSDLPHLDHELTELNLKLKSDLTYYVQDSQKAKEHLQRVSLLHQNEF